MTDAKRPSRLIIADPGLQSRSGHHFPYTEAVRQAAAAAGIPTAVWAHKLVNPRIAETLKAKPVFRLGPYGGFSGASCSIGRVLYSNAITAEDLKSVPDPAGPEDLVFFHTVSDDQLTAIAYWLAEFPEPARPRVEVLLRFHPEVHPDPKSRPASYAAGIAALAMLQPRLAFSTDTERLASWFESHCRIRCRVLPIPHVPGDPAALQGPLPFSVPQDAPIVAFLGDARADKGFTLLPALAELMAQHRIAARLLVHAGGETLGAQENDAVSQLRRLPQVVTIVGGSLRTADYHKLIARASVALLPYAPHRYAFGTSGVFAEAMAAGKPAIVTADTWMTDEAARLGGAVCALESQAPAVLTKAVESALRRLPELRSAAEQAAAAWRDEHNAGRLLECLISGKGLATRPS